MMRVGFRPGAAGELKSAHRPAERAGAGLV